MLYAEENNSNVHIVFQQSLQLKIKEYDDGLSLKITKTRETCIDMDFIDRKIRSEFVISRFNIPFPMRVILVMAKIQIKFESLKHLTTILIK